MASILFFVYIEWDDAAAMTTVLQTQKKSLLSILVQQHTCKDEKCAFDSCA